MSLEVVLEQSPESGKDNVNSIKNVPEKLMYVLDLGFGMALFAERRYGQLQAPAQDLGRQTQFCLLGPKQYSYLSFGGSCQLYVVSRNSGPFGCY